MMMEGSVSEYLTTMSMNGMLMTMTMTTTLATSTTTGAGSSASASATSSAMDMDMDMSDMNQYFTTKWLDYPVIFETMKASNGGKAFGIFLFLFVLGFLFRGLAFCSAYLEQKIFHNYSNAVIVEVEDNCECGDDEDNESSSSNQKIDSHESKKSSSSSSRKSSKLRQFFLPGKAEMFKDVIRLLLAFLTAMVGYALMVAAMSYVILYFFAVILGIAFGEVFFNRLAIVLDVNKNSSLCGSLH